MFLWPLETEQKREFLGIVYIYTHAQPLYMELSTKMSQSGLKRFLNSQGTVVPLSSQEEKRQIQKNLVFSGERNGFHILDSREITTAFDYS